MCHLPQEKKKKNHRAIFDNINAILRKKKKRHRVENNSKKLKQNLCQKSSPFSDEGKTKDWTFPRSVCYQRASEVLYNVRCLNIPAPVSVCVPCTCVFFSVTHYHTHTNASLPLGPVWDQSLWSPSAVTQTLLPDVGGAAAALKSGKSNVFICRESGRPCVCVCLGLCAICSAAGRALWNILVCIHGG